jgi:hypothetical protein
VESNETFFVNLSSAAGATIVDGQGLGTINNDDSGGSAKAAITSPTPGSTLPGASATFSWSAGSGVSAYNLYVGTSVGGKQIFKTGETSAKSATVSGIPTNGSTVYVRLWSFLSGGWQFTDYTYKAAGSPRGVIQSPTPGSTLAGSHVTFSWSAGSSASAYSLVVGTTPGGIQVFQGQRTSQLTSSVSGIPTNGKPVYVRLWSLIGSDWQYDDYVYQAANNRRAVPASAP